MSSSTITLASDKAGDRVDTNGSGGIISRYLGDMDPVLFWVTAIFTVLTLIFGMVAPKQFDDILTKIQTWVTSFNWFFLLSVAIYLLIAIILAFGKYGSMRLGKEDDRPEFSYISWIAMLFSCGVGVGYAFWAVGEPIMHYMNTPYLAASKTPEAMPIAIQIGIMHWGLHAWAIFAIVGLAIAFPAYRLGKPMNVSISLYGLFGEKIIGSAFSRFVEFLAAFATIAGVSTALGLGIISCNAGIKHIFGTGLSNGGMLGFMIILIICYTLSAVSGIEKGIKYLSNINIGMAFCWGLFILFSGPTNDILNLMVQTTGSYINNFIYATFWTDFHNKTPWLGWWTVFYWIWWISWGPFCGGFVARISKGRTIKEFMIGVSLVPTIVAIVWFSIVGGASQFAELSGTVHLHEALQADMGSGIYVLLSSYTFGDFVGYLVFINLMIFLITSADSASFFVAMQMSSGSSDPTTVMKLIWGTFIGSLALVLIASGGLQALQKASIIAGAPFAIVIFMMIVSLFKMLKAEYQQA